MEEKLMALMMDGGPAYQPEPVKQKPQVQPIQA